MQEGAYKIGDDGMKFIDMFCGMGTARMGFEQAGHECVYSIEWDKHKRRIYEVIFGYEPEGRDIRDTRAVELPQSDCWVAGFPCQDISVAGKQVGFEGNRSSLYFQVMRLLQETQEEDRPKYLLFENVKNFFSVNGGRDFLTALLAMDEVGYDAEWDLLNSKNFGVPQNRERVFIVGHLRGKSTRKVFPIVTTMDCKNPAVTCTARGYGSQRNGTYVIENPARVKQLLNIMANGKRENPNQGRVYDLSGLSPTLGKMEGGGRKPYIINDEQIRQLTPRECMRLQGVSDEITDKLIKARISDTQLYRAAGDAWSVSVGREIARRLI
jgi:DNA (cytosine-5)-methyltransferase 1